MPRKPDPTLKPTIIGKVIDHLLDTKLEDVSVRSLGRVLGTSAYPIVYHFGSREALIDAVVDQLASTTTCVVLAPDDDDRALADYLVAVFGGLDDPNRSLAARLAFEIGAVEALDHRCGQRTLHRAQVDTLAAWCRAHGYGSTDAERAARSAVLAARGLQWGALVDRDRADTDRDLRAVAGRLAAGADLATIR